MAKETLWYGKTEEEAKKVDLKDFLKYVPSRTRRSLQRGFTEEQQKLMKCLQAGKDNIKTHCRDMIIIPLMLGRTLKIHNGKEFLPVKITSEMLGHYLGEFSYTRKMVVHSSAGIGATKSSRGVSVR